MARGEGGPDSERERDEYIAWFGLSESEIVKGELISRFAENIIIGGGAIDDEFQFWMNRLELGGVSRRVTNDYLDRAKRRFEWVKKNYPIAGTNLIDSRDDKVLTKFAVEQATLFYALVDEKDRKRGDPHYTDHLAKNANRINGDGERPTSPLTSAIRTTLTTFAPNEGPKELHGKPFITFDINAAYGYSAGLRTKAIISVMRRAAHFLDKNPNIAGIFVESWLIAANPEVAIKAGFTILYAMANGQPVKEIHATRAYMTADKARKYLRK